MRGGDNIGTKSTVYSWCTCDMGIGSSEDEHSLGCLGRTQFDIDASKTIPVFGI